MPNMDFVTDRLATGGDLPTWRSDVEAASVLLEVVEMGITHVLDAREEWSDEAFVLERAPHIRYLHNPADDAGQRMPDEWFDHGVAFALAALEEPDTKLLVHCHMGINRGPSLAYAVMLALGFDPVDAIDRIRRARPIAHADYAEDALDWWQRRSGTSETTAAAERRALREWRRNNKLDVVRIIREQREMGA